MPIKKTEIKFTGNIQDSNFLPDDKENTKPYEGKKVEVTMKEWKQRKDRSDKENRYYWGVVIRILCDEWGYSWRLPKERLRVHSIIKEQFLTEPIEIKGKILKEEISTTDLSTIEFESLMTTIREWASLEFGIYIPLPNEVPFDY